MTSAPTITKSKGVTVSKAMPAAVRRNGGVLQADHRPLSTTMRWFYAGWNLAGVFWPSRRSYRSARYRNFVRRLGLLFPIKGRIGAKFNMPVTYDDNTFESQWTAGQGVLATYGEFNRASHSKSKPSARVWRDLPSSNVRGMSTRKAQAMRIALQHADEAEADDTEAESDDGRVVIVEQEDDDDADSDEESGSEEDVIDTTHAAKTSAGLKSHAKISVLELELAKLRDQIAMIVSNQQSGHCSAPPPPSVAGSEDDCFFDGPPPPPPPPPELDLTPKENVWNTIKKNISATTGNKPAGNAASLGNGAPDMMAMLKDMGKLKLRTVERSPGGTPIRRAPVAAPATSAADIIAQALKRKFAHRHREECSHDPASSSKDFEDKENSVNV